MSGEDMREWMGRLARKGAAARLVRGRLGCACPERVFEHLWIRAMTDLPAPAVQLIIGDRLLVRVIGAPDAAELERIVPVMLEAGILERDSRGLNRFRMVVLGPVEPALGEKFARMARSMGPRVHFHVLDALQQAGKARGPFRSESE